MVVELENSFVNPVVIMGVLSTNDADPATVRVTEVTDVNFKVQV